MRQYETYRCNKCGNEVEVQNVGGGALHCCGEKMEMITENLTAVNLMKAFAGESMARNKYEYFAKIAQKEGYRDIAEHFQRAANNEKMHAKLELKMYNQMTMGKEFGDTVENLKYAIEGESYENVTMYPDFAAIAKEEEHKEVARILAGIGKIEVEHENMYRNLLKRLETGAEHESDDADEEWICEVCGHVHRGKKALKVCPVCKHPQEYQSRLNSKK
ncbi:ferritin family protein [Poseidonibacter ostreae]|jgi:desulfoferrodoxin-like iron-binding protein|uniref:Desulfoferrodoxin FeS4 iron-binding domain-containing protein n=1 Tax=Poseidonibacter ostreae TaxID=2654171 RepID=A0A6L4WRX3_9BACT|nr:ferritin family protein [Poseidonibacter ostreae]KAB7885360.1 desulfoferrodoxin FeS4 iron-binding domain-containing protein [Poseidonibacter ostreae]KAB7885773.1 desulfoferrodoxin FeS4 iron-binding domain-containing protein [Poseidonibacter ostreae]KAB7892997.1 desulfoferrodoxin FeS4 iron-binding domain-containing protein [Poseidonibacter ostreae]MAC85130.1 rubrerythrin family protein [Arcobacter sp.]|tara:strand:- start:4847 stop:5500 length:654 start_codon:yes stop_codon:yes gene_type:complete